MSEIQKTNPLGSEKISSLLLKFSIPTALTLLVNSLYNIVDQIFVGQGVGLTAIAATNVVFPFTTIASALALLLGDGCAARISLCLGRQEKKQAEQTLGNTLFLLAFVGIALVSLSLLNMESLLLLFGATTTALPSAIEYGNIVVLGLPFMMCNISLTAIIRSDGNPKYSMCSMMVGAAINIILDPIFIFVLHMGVKGAAIATIIGQIVSGLICLFYLPKLRHIHFHWHFLRLHGQTVWCIFSLGFSSFCTQIAATLAQVVMNNLMRRYGALSVYGSDIALSCYGMMVKLYQIVHSMFVGVASGTQPINGFNFGAKQYHRVWQTYRMAAGVSLVISIVWFSIFQLFSAQIAALFIDNDARYIEFAKHSFHLYFLAFFIYGPPQTTVSFFQAIGKPLKAMLISLSRQIVFLIPLSTLVLAPAFGLDGALIAAPIADMLTFILSTLLVLLEFRKWKQMGMLTQKQVT